MGPFAGTPSMTRPPTSPSFLGLNCFTRSPLLSCTQLQPTATAQFWQETPLHSTPRHLTCYWCAQDGCGPPSRFNSRWQPGRCTTQRATPIKTTPWRPPWHSCRTPLRGRYQHSPRRFPGLDNWVPRVPPPQKSLRHTATTTS